VTRQGILFKGIARVRDIVNGPDGELYLVLNAPDCIVLITTSASNGHFRYLSSLRFHRGAP
jgi:hypothetical protein